MENGTNYLVSANRGPLRALWAQRARVCQGKLLTPCNLVVNELTSIYTSALALVYKWLTGLRHGSYSLCGLVWRPSCSLWLVQTKPLILSLYLYVVKESVDISFSKIGLAMKQINCFLVFTFTGLKVIRYYVILFWYNLGNHVSYHRCYLKRHNALRYSELEIFVDTRKLVNLDNFDNIY